MSGPPSTAVTVEAELFKSMALIRAFERALLRLFSEGKLNGTTHTCIGQEAVAVSVIGSLDLTRDCVFSNHRCHGHFLAYGGTMEVLLAEIMGREGAVCQARGGSQHLHYRNFFTNGVQGSIAPVAAGVARAEKLKGSGTVVCCFLGDGTLGEGAVYEALNAAKLWELPILFALEDNKYAQSTPTATTIAGQIEDRGRAFGIETRKVALSDPVKARDKVTTSVERIRASSQPELLVFDTYRLEAHSKGDDNRDPAEVERFRSTDPYALLKARLGAEGAALEAEAQSAVADCVSAVAARPPIAAARSRPSPSMPEVGSSILAKPDQANVRQITEINRALSRLLSDDPRVVLFGEDVEDPYGGAFKASKGLSSRFPGRVWNTPISESLIAGMALGMAARGLRPVAEIMFGDFLSLCFDQIVNGMSKYPFMYGGGVTAPLTVRTPMGGRRGYGPTHSQCLEKHFAGAPGLSIVALSLFHDPVELLRRAVAIDEAPTLFLETKVDYSRHVRTTAPTGYVLVEQGTGLYPSLVMSPASGRAAVTLACYGGMAHECAEAASLALFEEEVLVEVVILTEIATPDLQAVAESAARTGALITAEESSTPYGFGAELAAGLATVGGLPRRFRRLGAEHEPIASAAHLEREQLLAAPAIAREAARLVR